MTNSLTILTTKPSSGYALIDAGENEKLERFGSFVLSRPDPQALWPKVAPANVWAKAHGTFTRAERGEWRLRREVPSSWTAELAGLTFKIRPSAFKHTGLFPEQAPNWEWTREAITRARRPISVLNLFGYTGGATLACAQAGASVTHVDGSKVAVTWARENAELNGLESKPIRWIVDDAVAFVRREVKRKKTYDAIIMDPPSFGHGPKRELWKIENDFLPLLKLCRQVLSPKPLFVILNGYAAGYSALAYRHNLEWLMRDFGGSIEMGELTLQAEYGERLLPCGIFARWGSWSE